MCHRHKNTKQIGMIGDDPVKNTKIRKYLAGDIILQEGEYNKTLHKILSGKVALYMNYGKTNEYLIEVLSFPQYFGEVSILIQHPCYCTAVAAEDTAILHLPEENFEEFIKNNPQNAILILKAMAKSLDSLNLLLHKIEHGAHPYTHQETAAEPIPMLSTAEFLQMPDSKTLFMQSHIEDELHEKIKTSQLAAEKDAPCDMLTADRVTQDRNAMMQSIMQNLAAKKASEPMVQEISEEANSSYLLPEVYPDFFLPGHKCYPDITHPEYKEFLFHKEYTCPNCKQQFDGYRISYNRLAADPKLSEKLRLDFHIFYKDFEAEWYDVVTCPHCYFSSLIDLFINPPYVRKEQFDRELLQIRSSMMLDFSAERTLDFVFMQHYIALACSRAFSQKYLQINACLWMNLCWLYRSVNDAEMVRLAEDKTIEAYEAMYRECDLSVEQQQRTCLTIAGIYFDREEFAPAREWAFAVRMFREGKVIYRNLAQSIIDESRQLIADKKKEADEKQAAEIRRQEEERIVAIRREEEERRAALIREAEARKEEKLRKKEEARMEEAVKKESARREAEARKEAEAAQKGWFMQGGHALT